MTDRYTIASTPPTPARRRRYSSWEQILKEFRQHPSVWRRVSQVMTKSVAVQLASDFRSVQNRDLANFRVRGVLPGDRFESSWGHDPSDSEPSHYYLWLSWSPVPSALELVAW
jgi:hypothetical protein